MMLAYRGFAPDFLETYTDNIAKITAEDVQAVAQKYLHPDALTIVTVGNKANFDRSLDEFGEVNEIEIKQPAPPPAEPMPEASEGDMAKAKEIIAAAVEAYGGFEKLQAIKNIVVEGRSTASTPMGQMDLDVKGYQVYPDKLRHDTRAPQGEISYSFDGTSGFAMTPMGPQPLPPEMDSVHERWYFQEPIWLLASLMQDDSSINTLAQKSNGESAAIVLVPQPSGEILRVFISEETHYIVKMGFVETEQGRCRQ